MSFSSGQSRLIELPPQSSSDGGDDASGIGEFFEASSHQELMDQLGLDDELAHRLLLKGERFASYEILKFIGQGGTSDVYVARHIDSKGLGARRPVALKILRENQHEGISLLSLLEREAEICHALSSPHVVRIYEYGLSQTGQAFMALELLIGEELFDRRMRTRMLSVKDTIHIACQVLRGLEAIHAQGVVHRDLKSENIFLVKTRSGEEQVKIIDLGLARYVGDDPGDPLLLDSQRLWGTPHYLSPEQTRSPVVDQRSDIYAMGVMLYECLTGTYPFDAETPYAIMMAHQSESPPMMPSTIDHELGEIIYKALAKNPDYRWQSALEMREALERWVNYTSWDGGLPGMSPNSFGPTPQDGLFNKLLDAPADPKRDSSNLLPEVPIDRFQRGSALRQTPMLGEFNTDAKAAVDSAAQLQDVSFQSFDSQRAVFEEAGAVPTSSQASPAPSPVLRRTADSGSQPALRMPQRHEPLHSSPIELAETKVKRAQEPEVVKLKTPEEVMQQNTHTNTDDDSKVALYAMLLLGISLVIALILLLIL